jgi:ESS family glutamate:Na+ symporter
MDLDQILVDLAIISILLIIGAVIRDKVRIFQKYVIPASVLGGILGLILGHHFLGLVPISGTYPQFASVGIDVVFAGLFIGRKISGFKQMGKSAGAQTLFAFFNGFGQIAIGLFVVILFSTLGAQQLHPAFGVQLVAGFQGGIGIGTAVAPMMEKLGWVASEAAAVGETCAFAGLALSVIIGIIIVNIGVARNLPVKKFDKIDQKIESPTFLPAGGRQSVIREITSPEAASTFVFNFGIMSLAILCGHLIHFCIITAAPLLKFLPKFPFVLIGGIIIQLLLQRTRLDKYADRGTVESISSFALDVVIVASLMAIEPKAVAIYSLPLVSMVFLGILFNVWQVKWMAPRILPGAWFEKGICEFGQSTGSTPQAMLLLRMIDPRLETDAAESFALKMVFFSPVMFPMTMILVPFIVSKGPVLFMGIYVALMLIIIFICRIFCWQERRVVK